MFVIKEMTMLGILHEIVLEDSTEIQTSGVIVTHDPNGDTGDMFSNMFQEVIKQVFKQSSRTDRQYIILRILPVNFHKLVEKQGLTIGDYVEVEFSNDGLKLTKIKG